MICRLDCTIKIKMLKQLFLISSLLLLTTICSAQADPETPRWMRGNWENTEDVKSTLTITDKLIIEQYNGALIDTFSYTLNYNAPCDTTNKDTFPINAVFLIETSIHTGYSYCYYTVMPGYYNLTLKYLFNGYEAVFNRRKE